MNVFEVTDVRKVVPGLDRVWHLWREKQRLSNDWFWHNMSYGCLVVLSSYGRFVCEMSSLMT